MNTDLLLSEYREVLSKINLDNNWIKEDRYSGVFLPVPFDAYENTSPKILFVGRETAGWNTNNNLNTMGRIIAANENGTLDKVIGESIRRYEWHLKTKRDGVVKKKERSHLKRYYLKVANDLGLPVEGLIYSNLFAWDYDKKSPFSLPKDELKKVAKLSHELMAVQIKLFKPDYIIFATGVRADQVIKDLFKDHLGGYETKSVNPRKLWEFKAAGARCFRIAHPRAQNGHAEHREEVIKRIQSYHTC